MFALVLLLLSFAASAGTSTVTCEGPTQYTDDTAIAPDVVTYRFYRSATFGGPFDLETRTSETCEAIFTDLPEGRHWFVITAVVNGEESDRTDPVRSIIRKPRRPTGARVQPP